MRVNFITLLIIIISNTISLNITFANDEPSKKVIAVVDVQMILERSQAAQSIRMNIETLSKDIQKQMDQKTADLKKLEEELSQKRDKMSEENFEKDLLDFNKKFSSLQRQAQKTKGKLEQAYSSSINKVQEEIIKIINDLAKENNFEVVIPTSIVIYHAPTINITETVIERLNQRLKNVKVDF